MVRNLANEHITLLSAKHGETSVFKVIDLQNHD